MKVLVDEEDCKAAIEVILQDKKAYTTSLNYAVNYCEVALCLSGEALRVQCLYILNNITHWRGPGAKDCRDILKTFSKKRGK